MSVTLNPYVNFRGEAREAGDFYASVLGGEITRSTFADYGIPAAPGQEAWIMHSQLVTPLGLVLMVSDVPTGMDYTPGTNISISLSGGPEDADTLRGYFEGLSAGGAVTLPLDQAPWGDWFGQLTDRFGIDWLVNIGGSPQ